MAPVVTRNDGGQFVPIHLARCPEEAAPDTLRYLAKVAVAKIRQGFQRSTSFKYCRFCNNGRKSPSIEEAIGVFDRDVVGCCSSLHMEHGKKKVRGMNPISKLTPTELLAMHADITEELRKRGIVRSSNNPTADVAELLFCRAFRWQQAGNSNRAADATCAEGKLYQIKARRLTAPKTSRELGALRNLPAGGFHFLAAVLFESNYTVDEPRSFLMAWC